MRSMHISCTNLDVVTYRVDFFSSRFVNMWNSLPKHTLTEVNFTSVFSYICLRAAVRIPC